MLRVIGHVAILAIFALPVSMGVAILKYRLGCRRPWTCTGSATT
jgi:hypothetical protein